MSHEIRTPLNAIVGLSEIINKADILYFSGGSTAFLINFFKKNKLLWIIDEAIKRDDLIIAGVSAGAIMLSSYGLTDQEAYEEFLGRCYVYAMQVSLFSSLIELAICYGIHTDVSE